MSDWIQSVKNSDQISRGLENTDLHVIYIQKTGKPGFLQYVHLAVLGIHCGETQLKTEVATKSACSRLLGTAFSCAGK